VTDEAAIRDLLAPIRERNRGKLLARLDRVRAAALVPGPVPDSPELRDDLHALIGALGTYGWPAGSELVARVQKRLNDGAPATDLAADLAALIAEVSAT
jgi:hypothetical protein